MAPTNTCKKENIVKNLEFMKMLKIPRNIQILFFEEF
jgi:hypothetical protein